MEVLIWTCIVAWGIWILCACRAAAWADAVSARLFEQMMREKQQEADALFQKKE